MFDNSFIKKKIEVSDKLTKKFKSKTLWNTEKVDQCIEDFNNGNYRKDNPFIEGKTNKRKPELPFEYSSHEMSELSKCYKDVVYFANNYCKVVTDDGVMNVKMRDYQENMLHKFQKNRFNILLASRQIGKCVDYNTNITIRNSKTLEVSNISIGDFFYSQIERKRSFKLFEKIKLFLINILNILKDES